MSAAGWVAIAIVAVIVIALIVWAVLRKRRTSELRDRFGPEYERAMTEEGGRRGGESVLSDRVRRRDELNIRPLAPAAAERYRSEWKNVQARFVDEPSGALGQADRLVGDVMRERGYPMDDFDQRSADISVDHPEVVDDYRAAHGISMANDQGVASTEDLRQAMVHYRSLFERLVEVDDTAAPMDTTQSEAQRESDEGVPR
jgi:hypothetical protein